MSGAEFGDLLAVIVFLIFIVGTPIWLFVTLIRDALAESKPDREHEEWMIEIRAKLDKLGR
jgi:hypothetical protein